ncbi:MAG: MATE family efflux transporter [Lachnospiraceae bacterium]|nr:MATE family efflux transporter [Lachnospiraceae bacterium]
MNEKRNHFRSSLLQIALPVTLQSLLQSSFSMIDQIMIGQLGSDSIAGIGLGGKFASIYSVVLGAVAVAAGIMIAQYIGQKNDKELAKSFHLNLIVGAVIAVLFMAVCNLCPQAIMTLYTKDASTSALAVSYLRIYSFSFIPMALTTMMAVLLRCVDAAVVPLVASFLSVILNTGLNYLLIFGKFGCPALGVRGAAIASVMAQAAACILTFCFFLWKLHQKGIHLSFSISLSKAGRRQYIGILAPILICEFAWSLGENVYTAIYGNLGTDPCAAMTMTGPVQGLMIGALSGISQAAGIMIGKSLGKKEYEKAYGDSKKLIKCGLAGSLVLSILLVLLGRYYVAIYNVEPQVRETAYQILIAFAIISPVKVQNMILGGGIIRSGGMTKYVMWIDLIGTWIFGVPLGLLAAFVWKLDIPYVYFVLSLEEIVRLLIAVVIFRKRSWMKSLE